MKFACLLPTSGDPLLARYWLNNYTRVWKDEVDELLVYVNGDTSSVPLYEQAGARIVGATDQRLIHGVALTELVRVVDADAVVLMEDDAFVRTPGTMWSALNFIAGKATDVIGTPRGGMSPELHAAAIARWGPEPTSLDTSHGYGLWPCFLFTRPNVLRSLSDMRFSSLSWSKGQVIPGIEYEVPNDGITTDTMTLVAYQLHDLYRITPGVQYKEMWQKDLAEMTRLAGNPPWFHAGGLANEPASARPDIGMDNNEGKDWAHRFWWWRRIGHDYTEHYQRAGLDPDYWTPIIEPWINWDE